MSIADTPEFNCFVLQRGQHFESQNTVNPQGRPLSKCDGLRPKVRPFQLQLVSVPRLYTFADGLEPFIYSVLHVLLETLAQLHESCEESAVNFADEKEYGDGNLLWRLCEWPYLFLEPLAQLQLGISDQSPLKLLLGFDVCLFLFLHLRLKDIQVELTSVNLIRAAGISHTPILRALRLRCSGFKLGLWLRFGNVRDLQRGARLLGCQNFGLGSLTEERHR